jgi:L-iditol 2-dehydrogenase
VRVAVYYANDDVRIEERPRPATGADELLLRVMASGVCGSDVMEWYRKPRAPLVLGHEVAGLVEEAGERVTEFRAGDRIVTTHHVPCNRCRYCLSDRHSVCETLNSTNFDPGGFSELVRLPAINVERGTFGLPDDVSFEEGTFVEPLACVIRGQRLAGLRAGDGVAILGSGISGILHLLLARATGAGRIFATDTSDYRVKAAVALGADLAVHAGPDVVARVREANEGRGVDRVLVCTAAKPALEQALDLVDHGGSILYFALPAPGETLEFPAHDLWKRGVSIVHTYAGPPADMRTALELMANKRVDVTPMITHRLGLAETQEGFRLTAAAGESLKVIIDPQR